MLTCGFFNSKDHDRRYDALQFGSIFDGIVRDGIFMSIGDCFRVTKDQGMMVLVGIGRAWFNHTWTLNDALLPIEIPQSEILLNRIDAIVIDVNNSPAVRNNTIHVVKGTPATNPVRPALIRSLTQNQYPLAYVYVGQRVTEIRQENITNMIGTSETPFVTGILETVNIDMLVAQWGDQWRSFFERETADMTATNQAWKNQWESWFNSQTELIQNTYKSWIAEWTLFRDTYEQEMETVGKTWKEMWETWFYAYVNDNSKDIADWKHATEKDFNDWWDSIKAILDENCCSQLTQAVLDLAKQVEEVKQFKIDLIRHHIMWDGLYDNGYNLHETILDDSRSTILDNDLDPIQSRLLSEELILDSDGNPIECRSFVKIV